MKSKVAERILSNTPQRVKDKVEKYTNSLLTKSNMKKLTILLLTILLLSGCVTAKKCSQKFPPETVTIIKDSIREKTTYRDTTIFIRLEGETRMIYDTLYVNNSIVHYKSLIAETKYATARAWVALNRINLTLSDKDTTLEIRLKNALESKEFWQSKYMSEKQVIHVKQTPRFYKYLLWIDIFLLLGLALYLYRKFS